LMASHFSVRLPEKLIELSEPPNWDAVLVIVLLPFLIRNAEAIWRLYLLIRAVSHPKDPALRLQWILIQWKI
jgi:hypothetical protein